MKQFSLLLLLPFFSLVVAAPIFSRDINAFLAEIALLFPFSGLISDISGLLTAAEQTLASFFGIQTTQNGLSGSCGAVTVIFARGTTEPGNVGVLVGPPFFDALKSTIGAGNVVVQGVDYPASVEGFLVGGDSASAQTMYDNLPIPGWGEPMLVYVLIITQGEPSHRGLLKVSQHKGCYGGVFAGWPNSA